MTEGKPHGCMKLKIFGHAMEDIRSHKPEGRCDKGPRRLGPGRQTPPRLYDQSDTEYKKHNPYLEDTSPRGISFPFFFCLVFSKTVDTRLCAAAVSLLLGRIGRWTERDRSFRVLARTLGSGGTRQ
ncbi:hypothetical protein EVAR_54666_1 [Eumeta japonica]|uniref:Uncharacterized protein n=1 Tax=Eumeta variegata TaxID=151549 RepID=A0A4C1X7L1_EUMVA|nr:hypothetical protein EVAR_54666_1 [Eumeta japonica]